jgi:hypothetical protein
MPLHKRLLRKTYRFYRPILTSFGLLPYMAKAHGTDKALHGYLEYYRHFFGPLRRAKLKLLEIGVGDGGASAGDRRIVGQGGASLRMWKDYFPNAQIFAIDIVDKTHLEEPRITIARGDQNDPGFLDDLAKRWGPFDIVIDDGSHVSEHVITSFRALFPHVKDGGYYVVEDLFFSYDDSSGGSSTELNSARTSVGMLKTLVDEMHFKYIAGRGPQSHGDRIVGVTFLPKICFIKKGDNTGRDRHVESYYEQCREDARRALQPAHAS